MLEIHIFIKRSVSMQLGLEIALYFEYHALLFYR